MKKWKHERRFYGVKVRDVAQFTRSLGCQPFEVAASKRDRQLRFHTAVRKLSRADRKKRFGHADTFMEIGLIVRWGTV